MVELYFNQLPQRKKETCARAVSEETHNKLAQKEKGKNILGCLYGRGLFFFLLFAEQGRDVVVWSRKMSVKGSGIFSCLCFFELRNMRRMKPHTLLICFKNPPPISPFMQKKRKWKRSSHIFPSFCLLFFYILRVCVLASKTPNSTLKHAIFGEEYTWWRAALFCSRDKNEVGERACLQQQQQQ